MERTVPGLMVATKEEYVIRISKFEEEEQHDRLKRIISSVNEVADEDEASLRWVTG